MSRVTSSGLLRAISRWDLVALVINGTIGAGIFGSPSKVYALTGSYSLVAFGFCAVLVALILLCFAEVSSRFEETGGVYLYAREAFGPLIGFEVGWLIWIQRVTGVAVLANLLVSYLGFLLPAANAGIGRASVITAVIAVLTAANLRGVRVAAVLNNFFTVGKLLPLAVFIGVGLFFVDWD